MITKVSPKIIKQNMPIRQNLKKASGIGAVGLAILAGSSMSNMSSGPELYPTEMVIPGGLKIHEYGYYLLTHRLPASVYERWIYRPDNYIPEQGDQVVTINRNGRYIGSIVEGPRRATIDPDEIEDITNDILSIKTVESDGSLVEISTDLKDFEATPELSGENLAEIINESAEIKENSLSLFEIWKHIAGFPD